MFELILTDTDSLYIAFARTSWIEMVKARYREVFLRERDEWLVPDRNAPNHKELSGNAVSSNWSLKAKALSH
ncbi:hypothetical protein RvY_11403 [Ramazzottius varieornatus]|uniref:Uncharacterized protein n=1 Tax=Ramazzottius varieornatus TaxID=947166 RepID=A0A1D1VIF3_RAMVA|nr:hypothetical protein RvY_11403 [Ramazzottius varieornatus]